jgi:hypothetical protein
MTEARVHRKLARHRIRGEWFATAAVLELVKDWCWPDCRLFWSLKGHVPWPVK